MRDVIAAALASSLFLAAAGLASSSRAVQDYLERTHAALAAEPPLRTVRG